MSEKVKNVKEFFLKSITNELLHLSNLIKICFFGHPRYTFVAVKIVKNLISLGLSNSDFDTALDILLHDKRYASLSSF